jgi:uncharacterized protein YrrD
MAAQRLQGVGTGQRLEVGAVELAAQGQVLGALEGTIFAFYGDTLGDFLVQAGDEAQA